MSGNLAAIVVSALLATLNPTLLAAVATMLLLPNPKRLMLGYLLGAYTTSIAAGVVVVFSLHGAGALRGSGSILSPGLDIAVGVLAVAIGCLLATGHETRLRRWRKRRKEAKRADKPAEDSWQTRMLAKGSAAVTFVVGAAMSFPGVTYLNALDHIVKLNPSTVSVLLLILFFCLMQQMLLEFSLMASIFAGDWTQSAVVRFKAWLARDGRKLAVFGLSGAGVLLTGHGLLAI